MNDPQNMPVEPHDDGTVQEDPLYQEPSEGIVTHVDEHDLQDDRIERASPAYKTCPSRACGRFI